MSRINIEDLPVTENLTPEQEELIEGAGLRSFRPSLEGLEDRQLMAGGLASALPVSQPTLEPAQVSVRQFLNTPQVEALQSTASYSDPLSNFHNQYVGLKDLRKGDILLNTTEATISKAIHLVTNSVYNHAAIYLGDGQIMEAVGHGVRQTSLKQFLSDNDIVRTMVVRDVNLSDTQRDKIAEFAISKNGKPYNFPGLIAGAWTTKLIHNADDVHLSSYYCSQLVTAAYSYAGAKLHVFSIDLSPAELASRMNNKLSAVGSVYDRNFHRSVREGRDGGNQDLTDSQQKFVSQVVAQAETLLKEHIIGNVGKYGVLSNRWGLYKDGRVSYKAEVVGDGIRVTFQVYNRIERDPARVVFIFAGKNVGGQKEYVLTGAGLHDYQWKVYSPLGRPEEFEGVAKELFQKKMGGNIKVQNYDEPTVAKALTSAVKQLGNLSKFDFDGVEGREGGLRVWGKLADGSRVYLDFQYQGRNDTKIGFKLVEVARFRWSGSVWQRLDLGEVNGDQLKSASYRV
jgi:hypothetical protein